MGVPASNQAWTGQPASKTVLCDHTPPTLWVVWSIQNHSTDKQEGKAQGCHGTRTQDSQVLGGGARVGLGWHAKRAGAASLEVKNQTGTGTAGRRCSDTCSPPAGQVQVLASLPAATSDNPDAWVPATRMDAGLWPGPAQLLWAFEE